VATDTRTDSELLVAARQDGHAFGIFYRRHSRAVLGFFRRRVPSPELAFDLTAETFATAIESLERYVPGPEPASAWLYGIARNKLAEALRLGDVQERARRSLAMQPLVLDDEGVESLERQSAGRALSALDSLPREQAEAIRARHLEEREYGEIATELRCSESVVRKRVSRGLTTLRQALEDTDG
jgi:RNA polymerase sigma factor (sigma-70 family)